METFIKIITACAPVAVALIGIIPTIIANRKKTERAMEESNAAIEKRIDKIQSTLDAHIKEAEFDKAKSQRLQILRFYDEIVNKQKHSESVYEDVVDIIDEYEKFCKAHEKDFKNNRGAMAMEDIKKTYHELKSTGRFEIKE